MNALTKYIAAPLIKAYTQMRHAAQSIAFGFTLKRTRYDYAREVGDGLDSSVVTGPIMWMQRSLNEATLALRKRLKSGAFEAMDDHAMLQLIRQPNKYYGDIALWMATVLSFLIDGNAYWIKVRNGYGKPVELWWVPWWMVEPKASIDGSEFLSHYEYNPGTGTMYLDPEDVVHFRYGINPRDIRKGLSPLHGVIREIFIDLESSNFIASLLRNMGVPGVVISPKGGSMPMPEDVEATKTWFKEAFGGDNRGGPLVMGAPTDVESYGFNPQQMNLSYGSDRAEERVCVCIGIPAAVVGFGAGLQQTKVGATMSELCKLAWTNGVLPTGKALADELQRSLLPDFQREKSERFELYWNTDDVPAMQEDEDKKSARKLKELEAGAITLWDYLTETGREADDSHKYYLRKISTLEVPVAQAGKGRELVQRGDPAGQKSLPAPATKNSEDWLPPGARDASPDAIERGERFVAILQMQERGQFKAFATALMPLFEDWGDEAGRAARQILIANGEVEATEAGKARGPIATKADRNDPLVRMIIELLNIEAWQEQLSSRYQAQYLAIAKDIAEAVEQSGFGTSIPDPVMRDILRIGGTRAGLVDLDGQTRRAVFDALAEGRAEGEGVNALTNRIANMVEGGHWGNAETRARVIARTETKHAQNLSTIKTGLANGVAEFVVFDGRFGEPRSELSHIARDGKIVSAEDAQTMAENMRPNCTLSFAPHFSL